MAPFSSFTGEAAFLCWVTRLWTGKCRLVSCMGKRKVKSENRNAMVLPTANDVLGVAARVLVGERFLVRCQDGKERLCRIRGKMKRRAWVREGDVVLVSPWDFQSDTRGDIVLRYRANQTEWLRSQGYLSM